MNDPIVTVTITPGKCKIEELEKKIEKIISKIEEVSIDTKRMHDHITFVEAIYEQIKRPFHFLMGRTQTLQSRTVASLI